MNLHQFKFSAASLLFLFLCANSFTQKSTVDYDLNEYKLPYLKRQMLEFYFSLANTRSVSRQKNNDLDPDKSVNEYFSSTLRPAYNFYLNSNKYQINQFASASFPEIFFRKYSQDGPGSNSSQLTLNPSLTYSGEFREYIAGRLFLEQNLSLQFSFEKDRNISEQINDLNDVTYKETYRHNSQDFSLAIPILIGWGRIERVEDARLAVYILDDLQKAGQLSREVNPGDINMLASRISEVQNKRFFDSRDKKIWELEQIDSILHDMGLIETDNIYYYTLLNDNWDYAASPVRESGFRISGGFSPEFDHDKYISHYEESYPDLDSLHSTDSETKDQQIGGGSLLRINYEKPLNLFWQFSVGNELNFTSIFRKSEYQDEIMSDQKKISLNNQFNMGFGYYPNTRTSMSLNILGSYYYYKSTEENEEDIIDHIMMSSINFAFNYYVSPQIRFYLSTRVSHMNDNVKHSYDQFVNANFDFSVNASLVYMLL